MIRINLSDKAEYKSFREKYLDTILDYIGFDKKDVGTGLNKGSKEKSKSTGDRLKKDFKELYDFLYERGKVKKENLRLLLAGPEDPPDSFGGTGGRYRTMLEYFDNIPVRSLGDSEEDQRARDACRDIFKYQGFMEAQQPAYDLLRMLDVRVCPYCNRIYTVTLPTKEELEQLGTGEEFRTTRATFDHYFSQKHYPYFAVSLFNLIPCCSICNLNKSSSEKQMVYPYDEGFDKHAVFRLIPDLDVYDDDKNVLDFLHGGSSDFIIQFMGEDRLTLLADTSLEDRLADIQDEAFRTRISNSIQILKLEELYREHKTEIMDILRNWYYFNKEYAECAIYPLLKDAILDSMDMSEGEANEENLKRMVVDLLFFSRTAQQEWEVRPLSKLIADVIGQMPDV